MPTQIGTVKEAKGSVVAIDASGIRRVIRVGDAVYEGEVVKTNTMSSKVVITMNDSKEITIFGNDTVSMNQNQNLQNIAQNDQVADVSALQQALLNGGNLENLEETAAGGATAGGTAGIGGTSLGSVSFLSGGHETNVNANYNSLGALPPDAIATNNLGLGNSNNLASDDKTPPTVDIESVTPVDTGKDGKADGQADKAIVKGKSDEPNARVTVTDEKGDVIGTGTTDGNGNFTVTTTKPVNPGDKVKVEVEDKAGNKGEDTKTAGKLTYDDTTPPTVNIESVTPVDTGKDGKADGQADKAIVKGKSDEPNARVTVTDEKGDVIGTGTTDGNGNFTVTTTKPVNPGDKVKVEVEDKAGNKGEDTKTAGKLTYDDTTPPTVDIDSVTPVDTNPKADGQADKAIVKGKSDEPNAPVTVTNENGEVIGTGTTDDKGNFEISTDKPVNPGDKVTATVTDKAGNKGENTRNAGDMDYTDKTAPEITLETVTPIDNSTEADGKADTVKVSGKTDQPKGSKVEISVGGKVIGEVEVGEGGKFEGTLDLKGSDVKPGTDVKATITDKAGNKGEDTHKAGDMDYTDKTKPTIDLKTVTPIDDSTEADGKADELKVSGTTDQPKGSKVEISVGGKVIGEVEVGEGGKFEGTLDLKGNDVKPGTEVKATITDKAGNKGEDTQDAGNLVMTDTTNPQIDLQTVTPIDDSTEADGQADKVKVSGTTDQPKGSVVEITANGQTIGTVQVGDNGKFEGTLTIPSGASVKPGDKVTATVKDKAGNKGEDKENAGGMDYTDTTKPTIDLKTVTPIDNSTEADGKADKVKVSGTTDQPNREVVITVNGQEVGRVTTDQNGKFDAELTIPNGVKIDKGTKVTATVTDKAGNKGEDTEQAGDMDYTDKTAPKITLDTVTPKDTDAEADGKANTVKVSGTTNQPNTKVEITVGGQKVGEVTTDSKGEFNQELKIPDGIEIKKDTPVKATVKDKAGNIGEDTHKAGDMDYTDKTAPEITLDTVTPKDTDTEADGKANTVKVSGKTNQPNTTVVITVGGQKVGEVTTDDQGNYNKELDIPNGVEIDKGTKVTATVKDKAGNEQHAEKDAGDMDYTDKTAPKITLDTVTPKDTDAEADGKANTVKVSGTTNQPNTKVEITVGGQKVGEVTTDNNGKYNAELNIPKDVEIKENTPVKATVTDKAGNPAYAEKPAGGMDFSDNTKPTITLETVTPKDTDAEADGKADKVKVSGKTNQPNTTVVITVGGQKVGEVTTDDQGNYNKELDIPNGVEIDKGTKVTATVKDKAGNPAYAEKPAGGMEFDDKTKPEITLDTVTPKDTDAEADGKANTVKVSGKTNQPNTEVTISVGGVEIGKVITDKNGDFSKELPIPKGVEIKKDTEVKATVKDKAGNIGEDTRNAGGMDYTDTTPPKIDLQKVTPVDTDKEADGKANTVKVSGKTDQPNTEVTITVGGKEVGKVTTDEKGNFNQELKIPDGIEISKDTPVKASVTDKIGRTSEDTRNAGGMDYTDTTPPKIDLQKVTPVDTDPEADGKANTVKVSGKTDQPNTEVTITVGGKEVGKVTTDEKGNFNKELKIPDGIEISKDTPVKASVTDKIGRTSEDTHKAGDMYDVTPTITHYMDDVNLKGVPVSKLHQKSVTNDATPELHGTAKPNAEVSIYDNGKFIGTTMSDAKGNFTFTSPALKDGAHNITAKTEYSRMSSDFDFTVDTKASLDLTVSDATKGSDGNWTATVSGKAHDVEVGRPVSITLPNGETVTTTVQSDGTFKTTVNYGSDISNSTMKVTASTTDNAGNLAKSEVGITKTIIEEEVTVENKTVKEFDGPVAKVTASGSQTVFEGDTLWNADYKGGVWNYAMTKRNVPRGYVGSYNGYSENHTVNDFVLSGQEDTNYSVRSKAYASHLNGNRYKGVVYDYSGKMTISGAEGNDLWVKTQKDTRVILFVDGKKVFDSKDHGNKADTYRVNVPNLNGEHNIQMVTVKSYNQLDKEVSLSIKSKEGNLVPVGHVDPKIDSEGYTYNAETGKYEITTTTVTTKTVSCTSIKGGSSVAEHDTIGTDNANTIEGHDGKMIEGKGGDDTITGSDKGEHIDGGNGNDTINAGDGNDTVMGGTGDDTIDGGKGNDYIDGGAGSDRITAGEGDDKIVFDKQDSKIDGGAGTDTLVLKGGETIDFSGLGDKITSIEKLQLGESKDSNGTNVTLSAKDVLDITDGSQDSLVNKIPTLKIDGDSKDKVNLKSSDNWTKVGGVDSDGYQTYESTSGGKTVHLQIDEKITTDFGQ